MLSIGCRSNSEPHRPRDYFPMTRGSYWEYEGEGNEFASFTREVIFSDKDRAQFREDNGGTVVASIIEVTDTAVIRIFSRAEAYGNENYLEKQSNENSILLQSPIKIGTRWEIPEGTREITDTQAVVKTPAGEFNNCIAVTSKVGKSTVVEYYKAGIGLVKKEFNSEGFTVTSTLRKYEIK